MENSTLLENYNYYEKLLLEFCIVSTYPYFFSNFHGASRYMENVAPLLKRTYEEINRNRRRLLLAAYDVYPEYMYCDPDQFNWYESDARTNIFDLYYLSDSGYVHLTRCTPDGHRKPEFFMLTPAGANIVEIPDRLDECFPVANNL